jgi:valyl-tRNA synthetase
MPYVTEHIWGQLEEKELLMIAAWPKREKLTFQKETEDHQRLVDLSAKIRNVRALLKIPAAEKIRLRLQSKKHSALLSDNVQLVRQLARAEAVELIKSDGQMLGTAAGINFGWEVSASTRESLNKEFNKASKYVRSLEKKLANKNFIDRAASAVVKQERGKLVEAKEKLKELKKML